MINLSKKIKFKIACTLTAISFIFLSPIFFGMGCNSAFSYNTDKYSVTGSCKFGLIDAYFLSQDKRNYFMVKAINMQLVDNNAIYIYDINVPEIPHNREAIKFISNIKYNSYYQMHTVKSKNRISFVNNNDKSEIKLFNNRTCLF